MWGEEEALEPAGLDGTAPHEQAEGEASVNSVDYVETPGLGDPDQPLGDRLNGAFNKAYAAAMPTLQEASEHRAFYDGYQWSEEQRAELIAQGRAPIVINQVAKAIDNVCGRERGMRLKPKLLPRNAQDALLADTLTHAVEYVREASQMPQALSQAFKDAAVGPLGWVGVEFDDTDPTTEAIKVERIHPLLMLRDPNSVRQDLSDCRFLVRRRRVPYDVARAAYPEAQGALDQAIAMDATAWGAKYGRILGDYDNQPGRMGWGWVADGGVISYCDHQLREVELREFWWWHYESARFVVLPDGAVTELEEGNAYAEAKAVEAVMAYGPQVLREGRVKCFRWAVCAGTTVLATGKSEDKHRRFPYVPIWCKLDDLNRPYGLVRAMLDPQKELNTARARLNESARSRWAIAQEGLFSPGKWLEFVRDLSRSTFAVQVKNPAGLQIGSDKADAAMWANQQETARREIDDVAGLNEANYGDRSNETSGEAIKARAAQAAQNQGEIFDNLRTATTQVTQLVMALMVQYYHPEKLARLVEASSLGQGKAVDLDALRLKLSAAPVNALQFDVVCADQVETGTEQQAKMRQATDLMGMLPDAVRVALLPDVLRMSDLPEADAMAAKAEQFTAQALGQGGPAGPVPALPTEEPLIGAAPVPALAQEVMP